MVLIFLVTEVFQKVQCSNELMFHSHMRFYVTQWPAARFYGSLSAYSRPLLSENIAPWQPS